MPRLQTILLAGCLTATLAVFAPSTLAQVELKAPGENSHLKLFDFPGGTPEEFNAKIQAVFGGYDAGAVMMKDETMGQPLPALKVHRRHAGEILALLTNRVQINSGDNNWMELTFLPATGSEEQKAAVRQAFVFPGGTPADLVKAVGEFARLDLAAVTSIHPQIAQATIPQLKMEVTGFDEILGLIQQMSSTSAGSLGTWEWDLNSSSSPRYLMVTPQYSDDNPAPGRAALLAAGAGPALELAKLKQELAAVSSRASAAESRAAALESELSALKQKIPQ